MSKVLRADGSTYEGIYRPLTRQPDGVLMPNYSNAPPQYWLALELRDARLFRDELLGRMYANVAPDPKVAELDARIAELEAALAQYGG